MTDGELNEVAVSEDRPGIIKQFASAILTGDIADTLKIVKEVQKMDAPAAANSGKSIEELAIGDDDEAFYIGLIQENTTQLLRKNISPQEAARLTQNLDIFRSKLREVRSRKPKEGSTLAKILEAASAPRKVAKKNPTQKKTASKAVGATKNKKTTSTSSRRAKRSVAKTEN